MRLFPSRGRSVGPAPSGLFFYRAFCYYHLAFFAVIQPIFVLSKAFQDKFLRHNAIVFSGSMAAAFLNYLFHPVLSRLMSVQDFGEVETLLSLYGNLMFLGMFGTIVVNIVANTDSGKADEVREHMVVITRLMQLATAVALCLLVGIVILSTRLQGFFHFSSWLPFVALAPTVLISVSNVFRRAYLRGVLNFKAGALADILTAFCRLTAAAVLVWLGWRSFGAMIGIVLSMIAGWIFIFSRSRHGFNYVRGTRLRLDDRMRKELKYGLLILVVSVITTAFTMADVLIVKHYFQPTEAGLYSGVATIARIVVYVTGSVTAVLAPSVKMRGAHDENLALLRKALALVLLLGGPTSIFFSLVPAFTLKLLIGTRYAAAAGLLPPLSLAMLLLAVANTFFGYHVALRHYFSAAAGVAGLGVALVLARLHHPTPLAVIYDLMAGMAVSLAVFAAWWLRPARKTGSYVPAA